MEYQGGKKMLKDLVDICTERGLFLTNTCFKHKVIHWYTWRRKSVQNEQEGMTAYTAAIED